MLHRFWLRWLMNQALFPRSAIDTFSHRILYHICWMSYHLEVEGSIFNRVKHYRGWVYCVVHSPSWSDYQYSLVRRPKIARFPIHGSAPRIKCKTFEIFMSCINLATSHKTRPRTKHLCIKLHHFRSYIVNKIISIEYVSTKDQIADIFTKPLVRPQFCKLRDLLIPWS